VVYVLASTAIMGVVPAKALAESTAPFALMVSRLPGVGAWAAAVVAACALLKTAGTTNGWILVSAETSRASLDRDVTPGRFPARPDRPPRRILFGLAVLMTVAVFATVSPTLGQQFGVLINVSTDLTLAVYVLSCLALLRFSGRIVDPRKRLWTRVGAVVGAAVSIWPIATSGPQMIGITAGLAVLAVPLWLVLRLLPRRPALEAA
jgi:arginine:agmatine antiporter